MTHHRTTLPPLLLLLLLPTIAVVNAQHLHKAPPPSADVFASLYPSSLVANYPFDYSTEDVASTINAGTTQPGAVATVVGSEVYATGAGGERLGAFYFDGATRVATQHNINPSQAPTITVGAWVKTNPSNWGSSGQAYDRYRFVCVASPHTLSCCSRTQS